MEVDITAALGRAPLASLILLTARQATLQRAVQKDPVQHQCIDERTALSPPLHGNCCYMVS